MTLYIGAKLIKCDDDGKPVENEMYSLFEVIDLTGTFEDMCYGTSTQDGNKKQPRTDENGNTVQFVKIRCDDHPPPNSKAG